MNSDFDVLRNKDLFAPVVFRSDFNSFNPINANQAWSLFFSAGKEDKELGFEPEVGQFFTNLLIAIGLTGTIWSTVFLNIQ